MRTHMNIAIGIATTGRRDILTESLLELARIMQRFDGYTGRGGSIA
jgi:hypothetical protein